MPRTPPPRFAPEQPLPPYSYVTGLHPHPLGDPAGHSYGQAQPQPAPIDPAHWRGSPAYCQALDLFNHGYYWEAHEAWEGLWNACGRRGLTADFVKGLIKLAAAGVKAREGRREGVRRHAQRAAQLFAATAAAIGPTRPCYLGLQLAALQAAAQSLVDQPPEPLAAAEPVVVVFDFQLLPE